VARPTLDGDAISRLYRQHARSMVVFFARRIYDAETAVDLTAETFAAAFADRRQFRGSTDQEAIGWIYGIARHQLSAYFKRGQVERRALVRLGVQRRDMTDAELERIDELAGVAALRRRVAAALTRLSPEQQAAMQLRIVDERSYEETARLLGVSEQTVRARVSRGLRALAQELPDAAASEAVASGQGAA
jgi:RNA polymerase sigma-70 factor (ECF subfamily)